MRAEEERWANLSKLHAILRLFVPREMEQNIENWLTQLIENGVTGSEDHASIEGARTGAGSCEEVQAEVAFNDGGEGIPKNLQSSQYGLEGNKAKRPRRSDAPASPLEECNSSFQAPSRPAVLVQVPKSTSSELIFKSLKAIPELARCDFLRAYGALIRDDRQFESLMALPMDMRKDWLLMEIGKSDPSEAPAEEMDSKAENSGGEEAEADPARPVRNRRLPTRLAGREWIR
ncbi:uncharacterized protein LOC112270545 [Brachypodium distachyon]|uniref:Uncharacterized protein n=1 Tax=Brachypodium distachyon TaxID=15368 RepID=A0A2K2DC21_BRADI|nr:uncharacterized protein LOC112270545 [Brachypodium distachyon]PNT71812.1 hypothetical protein BRADI_2g35741v3 [Brachypodium distachyon]|eukprot:XP_024313956.1 uncharacterized protein LOC112270545 [Brachypodium distachyon]